MENLERLSEIATEFETAIEKFDYYEFDRLKRLIELNHELTKHSVLSLPHLENLMPVSEDRNFDGKMEESKVFINLGGLA